METETDMETVMETDMEKWERKLTMHRHAHGNGAL
jgi:hypothetical protein